jgi:hypothetical protein
LQTPNAERCNHEQPKERGEWCRSEEQHQRARTCAEKVEECVDEAL